MKNVFIIGSKGIPARYGGFETFVDKLTEYQKSEELKYHVACMGEGKDFVCHRARCFYVPVPDIGAAKAVCYDLRALRLCLDYIEKHQIKAPVIYILACRIGPFLAYYKRRLKRLGGRLYVNPDGHEWKRAKWNRWIRRYWRYSERGMIKQADLVVCDSRKIEEYIRETYAGILSASTFIPYGAEPVREPAKKAAEKKWEEWAKEYGLKSGEYYLIVGRFVPENNYETMLREYHAARTKKKLAIITNPDNRRLWERIMGIPGVRDDTRICFVKTVYDQELLQRIRRHAYAYLHGHEVGGTNPSLLEALAATKLNLLLDVGFNREVAEEGALYWQKEEGSLRRLIERAESLDSGEIRQLDIRSGKRIEEIYNWEHIAEQYEEIF